MGKERVAKLTYKDDRNYAAGRLQGTFVLHKGRMVRVEEVKGRTNLSCFCVDGKGDFGEFPLEELDLTPFKFGYVNVKGTCGYFYRLPMRNDWRQGHRFSQLGVICSPHFSSIGPRDIESFFDLEKPVIKGEFYSFPTCLDMLEDGYEIRAFHKNWAVDRNYNIWYKGGDLVGKYSEGTHNISLKPEFNYLTEALEEEVHGRNF